MRACSVWFLLIVMCPGCNDAQEHRRKASENNLKQIGLTSHDDENLNSDPISTVSHVIAIETEYYTTGPQQSRPPDGRFATGTTVSIVENSGSYVLVRSDNGVEAYVTSDAIKTNADSTSEESDMVDEANSGAR